MRWSAAPAWASCRRRRSRSARRLVPVDLGVSHHADLWLTYHKEFRNSERHKIVIDWLKKIFDPKTYPCFRDEFIHPNDLVPMMTARARILGLRDMCGALRSGLIERRSRTAAADAR